MKNKRVYLLLILLAFVLISMYRLKQKQLQLLSPSPATLHANKVTETNSPAPELNENLKDTLNLYLNTPAPYKTEERVEKENDLLMKLSSEIENRIDLPTFIYTFEHSASERKCSKTNSGYDCFAKVENNSGWKIILSSPAKDQLHFEKISWENLK